MEIKVLDHGYVKYIEHWGSDARIIESARMSTSKGFQGWDTDAKLLTYLYNNQHLSPFESCGITIEVQAPIFVVREWQRHRTQSYNELSGRYTKMPDLFYIPSIDRLMAGKQNTKNMQGSEDGFNEAEALNLSHLIKESTKEASDKYKYLIAQGVSREIARIVLPLNQYTKMRATANLRNWLQFLSLRLDESAQWEIRVYAESVALVIKEWFPRTYGLFEQSKR